MDPQQDTACRSGLRFFGRISASISHELKNALAVISESAGLAEDLLFAAKSGRPVDEKRLLTSIQRIRTRVEGADGIIKNMNTFAHGMDEPILRTDLKTLVDLTAALTKRLLDMQGAKLEIETPPHPMLVRTAPFYLENTLWLLLEFSMENRGDADTLFLNVAQEEANFELCFSGWQGLARTSGNGFPMESVKPLLDVLEAELEVREKEGELILRFSDLP